MTTFTVVIGKGNIEKETEKAICFDFGLGKTWLPKSQIEVVWDDREDVTESCRIGNVIMPYWLAKKNNLTQKPRNSMAW